MYGCSEFLDVRAIMDEAIGFLDNDWITLTAQISIEKLHELLDPQVGLLDQIQQQRSFIEMHGLH